MNKIAMLYQEIIYFQYSFSSEISRFSAILVDICYSFLQLSAEKKFNQA